MRERVPVPPVEDLVAQMQGDRAARGDPVRECPLFFVIAQKVTDIDCVQSDIEYEQKQKVRVKWHDRKEMAKRHAMP